MSRPCLRQGSVWRWETPRGDASCHGTKPNPSGPNAQHFPSLKLNHTLFAIFLHFYFPPELDVVCCLYIIFYLSLQWLHLYQTWNDWGRKRVPLLTGTPGKTGRAFDKCEPGKPVLKFVVIFSQSSWCLVSGVSEKYAWLGFSRLDFSAISSCELDIHCSSLCRNQRQIIDGFDKNGLNLETSAERQHVCVV